MPDTLTNNSVAVIARRELARLAEIATQAEESLAKYHQDAARWRTMLSEAEEGIRTLTVKLAETRACIADWDSIKERYPYPGAAPTEPIIVQATPEAVVEPQVVVVTPPEPKKAKTVTTSKPKQKRTYASFLPGELPVADFLEARAELVPGAEVTFPVLWAAYADEAVKRGLKAMTKWRLGRVLRVDWELTKLRKKMGKGTKTFYYGLKLQEAEAAAPEAAQPEPPPPEPEAPEPKKSTARTYDLIFNQTTTWGDIVTSVLDRRPGRNFTVSQIVQVLEKQVDHCLLGPLGKLPKQVERGLQEAVDDGRIQKHAARSRSKHRGQTWRSSGG